MERKGKTRNGNGNGNGNAHDATVTHMFIINGTISLFWNPGILFQSLTKLALVCAQV